MSRSVKSELRHNLFVANNLSARLGSTLFGVYDEGQKAANDHFDRGAIALAAQSPDVL